MSSIPRFALIVLLLLGSACNGDDPRVAQIDQSVRGIDADKKSLSVTEIELAGFAIEGGKARVFRDKAGNIALIEAEQYGEAGMWQEWLYFKAGSLIYARVLEIPLQDGSLLEAEGDSNATENQYYFDRDLMIHWIDSERNPVDPKSDEFLMVETDYRDYVEQVLHDIEITKN